VNWIYSLCGAAISMMTDREKTQLVRGDILRILWERGDSLDVLRASDLQFPEHGHLLVPAARWLEREGLIRLGRCQVYVGDGTGEFAGASLTARGESFLIHKPEGGVKAVISLIVDALRDVATDGLKDALKKAPMVIWASYEAWKATSQ